MERMTGQIRENSGQNTGCSQSPVLVNLKTYRKQCVDTKQTCNK